jgi:hypothetical protein
MHNLKGLRNPIPEIIKRHAGDAAFYWNQWDKAKYSFVIDGERLAHIEHLLIAHLDGLIEANDIGWQESLANFKRWKGAGETFVCCLLAMQDDSHERFSLLWPTVESNAADCTRGFISALIWYYQHTPVPTRWLDHWLATAESPLLKTVALSASACLGITPIAISIAAAQDTNQHLRAAACRTLALHNQESSAKALLQQLLNDPVISVTAEAAIGLLSQTKDNTLIQTVINTLWFAITQKLPELTALKGSKQRAAQRQLKRWLFYWAFHTQQGAAEFVAGLQQLPALLQIEAIGWHGNATFCSYMIEIMNTFELAPAALVHVELLTGCDAENTNLIKPADFEQLSTSEQLPPEYQGMPFPQVQAMRVWWENHKNTYTTASKILQGQSLDHSAQAKQFCEALIANAPQRIKRIAQYHLHYLSARV